jgi:hypothetical protein
VTTYTASRAQLVAALAEHIDWQTAPCQEHESFGDLADKILAMLVAHEPVQPVVTASDEAYRLPAERLAAIMARAHEAGRELGQHRLDAYGDPVRAVSAPEASAKVKRLRDWEGKRAG